MYTFMGYSGRDVSWIYSKEYPTEWSDISEDSAVSLSGTLRDAFTDPDSFYGPRLVGDAGIGLFGYAGITFFEMSSVPLIL